MEIETTVLIAIASVFITVLSYLNNKKESIKAEVANLERIKNHLDFLKDEINSIHNDLDSGEEKIGNILYRLTKAEESLKNTNKIIQKITGGRK